MSVKVWWVVRAVALVGAIVYLFLDMEWIEDRPASPLMSPGMVDPGGEYVAETPYRG